MDVQNSLELRALAYEKRTITIEYHPKSLIINNIKSIIQ